MYEVTINNNGVKTVIHNPQFNDIKLQSGQIKQGINAADSFSFSFLHNNPGYHLIREMKTLITVKNMLNGKIEFDGRVLRPTEAMDESGGFAKSFICESELGYLNDSCQRHGEYHKLTVKQFLEVIISNHNKDIASDEINKKFVVGEVTITNTTDNLYRYLGYEKTLDAIFDKLVDRLGGELRVRKVNGVRYLDYLEKVGEVKDTEIKLAKNLKSITKDVDPSQIITRLIPLGATVASDDETATDASQARITIASVNGGKDYIEDATAKKYHTVVTRSVTWDDVTDPKNLKTKGEAYLKENNRVKVNYLISALDLSLIGLDTNSFEVANYYPVKNKIMGIDESLRVVQKTIDIIKPNSNSLTFGDLFKTASQYQYETRKAQKNIVNLESTVLRQSQTIGTLKNEFSTVNRSVKQIEQTLQNSDLPGLQKAVQDLQNAINNLDQVIGEIPVYVPATETKDGLMSSTDKVKLDGLKNYQLATEKMDGLLSMFDKIKLDLITVTKAINLDELEARVAALEGGGT